MKFKELVGDVKEKAEPVEGKCEYPSCEEDAVGIIRTHKVCARHFNILKWDNRKRQSKKANIPRTFAILRETKESWILN